MSKVCRDTFYIDSHFHVHYYVFVYVQKYDDVLDMDICSLCGVRTIVSVYAFICRYARLCIIHASTKALYVRTLCK